MQKTHDSPHVLPFSDSGEREKEPQTSGVWLGSAHGSSDTAG